MEKVTYRSGDIDISALLYRPSVSSGKRHPAFVLHPSHMSPARNYEWFMGRLAEAGFVGLAIDQRGYGSGPDGVNDRGGPVQQSDISNGISYLIAQDLVDRERIGVCGHSNGAAMALIVSANDPRVRACVSLAPKADWVRALAAVKAWNPVFYEKTIREMNGGVPPEIDPEPYRARSPLTYCDRIRTPVMLIVGTQDWTNPSYHCFWIQDALRASGNQQVEVVQIEEAEHFFCRRHFLGYRFTEVTDAAIRWFSQHLGT